MIKLCTRQLLFGTGNLRYLFLTLSSAELLQNNQCLSPHAEQESPETCGKLRSCCALSCSLHVEDVLLQSWLPQQQHTKCPAVENTSPHHAETRAPMTLRQLFIPHHRIFAVEKKKIEAGNSDQRRAQRRAGEMLLSITFSPITLGFYKVILAQTTENKITLERHPEALIFYKTRRTHSTARRFKEILKARR